MSTVVDRKPEDAEPSPPSPPAANPPARAPVRMSADPDSEPGEPEREEPADDYQYLELNWPAVGSLVSGLAAMASYPLALIANPSLASGLLYAIIPGVGLMTGIHGINQIRRRPDEYTGIKLAWSGVLLSIGWAIVGWATMGYVYATEVPPDHLRVLYSEISSLDKNVVEIPKRAMELNGEKIFIKGYAYPVDQKTGIRQFLLCRDNGDCCFGGTPKLTDMIFVRLKDGLTIDYSTRVHKMSGKFRVEPGMGVNSFNVVYHLDDAEYH